MAKPRYEIPPDPVIEFYKKKVDRELIRENLKLTPEERIIKLMERQKLAQEQGRAGQQSPEGATE